MAFRLIVRGRFRLNSGKEIARAVIREVAGNVDDEERVSIALYELLEELQTAGYLFREGRLRLVQVLGTMRDHGEGGWAREAV